MKKNICEYWRTTTKIAGWDNNEPILDETVQYCIGTKNQDSCVCNGDKEKCDFYSKRVTKNVMNTAEMWLEAQKTKKYYRTVKKNIIRQEAGVIYNANRGFLCEDKIDTTCPLEIWDINTKNLDSLMLEEWLEEWEECETILTKEEAENKYNIKIVD